MKNEEQECDLELDARGLDCPLPILKTKKSLDRLASGSRMKVLATDPGSIRDFEAFSRQTGHTLLTAESIDGEFLFVIQKK